VVRQQPPHRRARRLERGFAVRRAVAKHTSNIFAKLDLPPSDDDNRRVLAVLAYLRDV
jgi:hypothetical protein